MSGIINLRARLSQAAAFLSTNITQNIEPVTNEFGEIVLACYNWLTRVLNIAESNPLSQQYVEQQLAAALSLATGTTNYPSDNGMSMGGYKDLGVELMLATNNAGNTMTVTMQASDDTTNPPAAGSWKDVSKAGYQLSANDFNHASWVASGAAGALLEIIDWDNLNARRFRIQVVVVTAGGTSLLTIWTRQKAL